MTHIAIRWEMPCCLCITADVLGRLFRDDFVARLSGTSWWSVWESAAWTRWSRRQRPFERNEDSVSGSGTDRFFVQPAWESLQSSDSMVDIIAFSRR